MLSCRTFTRAGAAAIVAAGVFYSSGAFAQSAASQTNNPPPPGYSPQPAGPPPPGYVLVPPGYVPGPARMDYDDGDPIPPGYHLEDKIRKGLVIGGAVTFGSLYLITAVINIPLSEYDEDFVPLYIPVVGPFVTIGTEGSEGVGTAVLVIDGIAQAGGLAMFIIGLAASDTELVRNDVGEPNIELSPMVSPEMAGISIRGDLAAIPGALWAD